MRFNNRWLHHGYCIPQRFQWLKLFHPYLQKVQGNYTGKIQEELISRRALARCPPVNKGQISPPFLLTLQICRRDVIFVVRRTTEKHSCILTGYVDALYALSFAVQTRKSPYLFLFRYTCHFFQNGLLFQDPYARDFQVNGWWNCCWSGRLAHGRKLSAHTAAERRRKSEIVFLFRFFYSNKSRMLLQRNSVVKFSHNPTSKWYILSVYRVFFF